MLLTIIEKRANSTCKDSFNFYVEGRVVGSYRLVRDQIYSKLLRAFWDSTT